MGPFSLSEGFFLFLLSVTAQGDLLTDGASCNPGINITGGTVTLSDGVAVGSVLKYTCPLGFYPYPKGTRTCLSTGRWSIMRDSQGRVYNTAICRGFHCPNPSIEQGTFFPKRVLQVPGDTVSFECLDGYKLLGSRSRTCLSNGQWNGSTTVCEDGMDTCPNPGTPPGSVKFGKNYDVGDKVRYLCQGGRVLIGSHDRTCLESGEWTGSEPRCQHEHAFDLPEEVARHFSSSFSHLLSESEMDQEKLDTFGRKISVRVGQKLHIYILLDISGSITKDEFYKAKEALQKFIDMISRFEVSVRYGVLLFGSQTTVVVNPADEWAIYSQNVADIVSEMKYEDYVVKRNLGTNMTGALGSVYKMMSYARTVMKDRRSEWNEIHHVILIFTDGRANVGGSPTPMMDRIRRFLEVERSREEFLGKRALTVIGELLGIISSFWTPLQMEGIRLGDLFTNRNCSSRVLHISARSETGSQPSAVLSAFGRYQAPASIPLFPLLSPTGYLGPRVSAAQFTHPPGMFRGVEGNRSPPPTRENPRRGESPNS